MPKLQRLRADHALGVLAFESTNRSYFAASVSDRGDAYFDHFTEQYDALLAEQETGIYAYHALVDDDGSILGRFNLVDIDDGTAELGFRVAEHVAGRGVATAAVLELLQLAESVYALRVIRARAAHENVASQRVLAKAGFVPAGAADVGGRAGTWFERALSPTDE
jgi:ribosomal-protein-alanine N-acetyltransferase